MAIDIHEGLSTDDLEALEIAEFAEHVERFLNETEGSIGLSSDPLRFTHINAFFDGQTRKHYDDHTIRALAESITESNMLHPVTVAALDQESAGRYVEGINRRWGTAHTLSDLTPNDDGDYFVLIAGHRRMLAVTLIVNARIAHHPEFDPNLFTVQSNVRGNVSLTEALKLQVTENTGERPRPNEEADSISIYWEERRLEEREQFRDFTYTQCAHELGYSRQKVRDAIRFVELPPSFRSSVEQGTLTYTWALYLHPYMKALELSGAEPDDVVNQMNRVVVIAREKKMTSADFRRVIDGRIKALQPDETELVLFQETAEDRRVDHALATARLLDRQLAELGLSLAHGLHQPDAVRSREVRGVILDLKRRIGAFATLYSGDEEGFRRAVEELEREADNTEFVTAPATEQPDLFG